MNIRRRAYSVFRGVSYKTVRTTKDWFVILKNNGKILRKQIGVSKIIKSELVWRMNRFSQWSINS